MRRFKRALTLALAAVTAATLTGCWDMVEINDRACIRGVGLDLSRQEGMISVTFQMLMPYETSDIQGTPVYENLTVQAATVSEAVDLLSANVEQKPHFEHLSTIALGEELAKTGMIQVMDYFYRVPQVRRNCEVVAVNGLARDLMASSIMNGGVGEYIENMMKTYDRRGQVNEKPSTMSRVFVLDANDEAFLLPLLDYQKPDEGQDGGQGGGGGSGGDGSGGSTGAGQPADAETLKLAGSMLFDEGRFVGTLNNGETDMVRLMQGQQQGIIVTLGEAGGVNARFSFRIDEARASMGCEVQGDHFVFPLHLSVQGLLIEAWDGKGQELGTADFYAGAEDDLETHLAQEMEAVIRETQRLGADVIGFSRQARQTHYLWYQNQGRPWRIAYRAAEFPITVDVTLKRGGHIQ